MQAVEDRSATPTDTATLTGGQVISEDLAIKQTAALINLVRRRVLDFPIILLNRRELFEDLPVRVSDEPHLYVIRSEETLPALAPKIETCGTIPGAALAPMPRARQHSTS